MEGQPLWETSELIKIIAQISLKLELGLISCQKCLKHYDRTQKNPLLCGFGLRIVKDLRCRSDINSKFDFSE
jgi:hypothetical protein